MSLYGCSFCNAACCTCIIYIIDPIFDYRFRRMCVFVCNNIYNIMYDNDDDDDDDDDYDDLDDI